MNRFWYNKVAEYTDVGTFFLSMLQNFLAKVISLTNMYFSIEENVEIGNITGLHYDIARTVRIVLIFDPIEPINDEELVREEIPSDDQLEDPDLNPTDFSIDTQMREAYELDRTKAGSFDYWVMDSNVNSLHKAHKDHALKPNAINKHQSNPKQEVEEKEKEVDEHHESH